MVSYSVLMCVFLIILRVFSGDDISDSMIAILNNFEVENTTGKICLLETDQNVNITVLHNRTILIKVITIHKRSCWKVIFSQVSVCSWEEGGGR